MLLWGQIAMKMLRRLYISENVQMRYRTARVLEIWDLAAASLPPSPVRPDDRLCSLSTLTCNIHALLINFV